MTSYLVPTDFSSAAFNALKLAEQLAIQTGATINLLHFCETIHELDETKLKLSEVFVEDGVTKSKNVPGRIFVAKAGVTFL